MLYMLTNGKPNFILLLAYNVQKHPEKSFINTLNWIEHIFALQSWMFVIFNFAFKKVNFPCTYSAVTNSLRGDYLELALCICPWALGSGIQMFSLPHVLWQINLIIISPEICLLQVLLLDGKWQITMHLYA